MKAQWKESAENEARKWTNHRRRGEGRGERERENGGAAWKRRRGVEDGVRIKGGEGPRENVEDHPREEFRTGWEPAAHAIPLGGPLSSASGWDHPGQPRPVRGPFAPATILHPIIDQ